MFRRLAVWGIAGALIVSSIVLPFPLNHQPPKRSLSTSSREKLAEGGEGTFLSKIFAHPTFSPPPFDEYRPGCRNLHTIVCRTRGETRDPTGFVRGEAQAELKTLRILNRISRKNSDWNREEIDEALVREVYTSEKRTQLESNFKWTQRTLETWIGSLLSFSEIEKTALKKRIHDAKLELPSDENRNYGDDPDLLTGSSVDYIRRESGEIVIRVGGAYLNMVTSRFNLIFTFAHELGHAIDPCEMRGAGLSIAAYDSLIRCFSETGLFPIPQSKTWFELSCQKKDPLGETFADWLSAQITSLALEEFSREFDSLQVLQSVTNSVRDLCDQDEHLEAFSTDVHASPQIRIREIFGKNPRLKNLLGCKDPSGVVTPRYCRLD